MIRCIRKDSGGGGSIATGPPGSCSMMTGCAPGAMAATATCASATATETAASAADDGQHGRQQQR